MSFRAKLTLGVISILTIVVVVLFIVVYAILDRGYNTLVEAIRARSETNVSTLALSVEFEVAAKRADEVKKIVTRFKKEQTAADSVVIFDTQGEPIASTGVQMSIPPSLTKFDQNKKAQSKLDDVRDVVIAVVPVATDEMVIGYALYTESLREPKSRQSLTLLLTIVVFVLSLAVAAVGAFFFGSQAAIPMSNLVSAAKKIAAGDLSSDRRGMHDSPERESRYSLARRLTRFQEVELLADSFQSMSNALVNIVRKLFSTSHSVASAVKTINSATEELVSGVEQQSGSAANVFKSIEQVNTSFLSIDANLSELNTSTDHGASMTLKLSRSLKALSEKINEFSSFVKKTDAAVKQMAASASKIAHHISTMASSTDSTAISVANFDRSIQLIETTAVEASTASQEASEKARTGQDDVYSTISGMDRIVNSFSSLESAFSQLSDRIDLISNSLSVIDDVAKKTKLLSVNTRILASQAGEHGHAFSVVAEEIRDLSERTNRSTQEISEIIESLNMQRENTTAAMDLGMESVREGQTLAKRAGESMKAILDLSEKSHHQTQQIAWATNEQVQESRAIAKAANSIASMGRDVFKTTEEQRRDADSVNQVVGQMVATLLNVQRTIENEVSASTHVAKLIHTNYSMAESISKASNMFKASGENIVGEAGTIRDVAGDSLSRAQSVSESIRKLQAQVDEMNRAVDQFKIG